MSNRYFTHSFLIFFSIVLCHLPLIGSNFGWDIFEQETVEANSFSSTEGLLSSLIANHVAAISGEFVDHATDCVLAGPEPLTLQRSYSSHPSIGIFGFEAQSLNPNTTAEIGSKYCAWQFNHLTSLHVQLDLTQHTRHGEISAFVPHAFFSQMLHRKLILVPKGLYPRNNCSLPLLHQKGVTNCSSGAVSGRTNPKNVVAHLYDKHKKCDVTFGSGNLRHYKSHFKDMSHDGAIGIWKFSPQYEKKANGNQIIYQDRHVSAFNSSGTTTYSWFKFKWISHEEMQIETSHSEPIIYQD